MAVRKGHINVVLVLLSCLHPEAVKEQNINGYMALHSAAEYGYADMVRVLLPFFSVDETSWKGATALHWSCVKGHSNIATLLLDNKANINAQDNRGHSALHLAIEYQHDHIFQLLIARGAKVNIKNKQGVTPLHCALGNKRRGKDNLEIVRLLLNNGADINAQTNTQKIPHYI